MAGNIGKKWTEIEETELLQQIKDGTDFEEIASLHKRTLGGIKARINKLAHIYLKEGMNIDKVAEVLRLDKIEMEYLIKKHKGDGKVTIENCIEDEIVVEEGSFEVLHNNHLDTTILELNSKIDKLGEAVGKIMAHMGIH